MKTAVMDGWILAWALTYLICAFIKPDIYIGASVGVGATALALNFFLLMSCVLSSRLGYTQLSTILCFIAGFLQASATVAGYVGIIKFKGPDGYTELAQLSMALLNFISSVCLITKGLSQQSTTPP